MMDDQARQKQEAAKPQYTNTHLSKKKKRGRSKDKTGIDAEEIEQEIRPLEPYEQENIKNSQKRYYWPIKHDVNSGKTDFVFIYKMWMLLHCSFILGFGVARVAFEEKPWIYVVYLEIYLDIVYLIDSIRIFTSPITLPNGKINWDRKAIAKNYIFGWFVFDLFAFLPLAYFRYTSDHAKGGRDNLQNLIDLNFERLPRFYKIMLLIQLSRTRFAMTNLRLLMKRLDYTVEVQNLIVTFVQLLFILHSTGCLWYSASFGNIETNVNWVTSNELEDAGLLEKFAISYYWATVTCTTVGYGDVLPTNGYELLWAMLVIVFGVAIFSYILSNLASQFSEISRNRAHN